MAITNSSLPSEKGTISEVITTTMPLGMIFYPTETVESEEIKEEKEEIKQLKIEILKILEEGTLDIGLKILNKMKIPPWFRLEEVISKWRIEVKRIFARSIEKLKEKKKLSKEDNLLLDQLRINRCVEKAIKNNNKPELKTAIKNYRKLINESFDIIENTLYKTRRKYGQIFLESKLNPKFMTYISKTINVIITYFHYLKSELNNIVSELRVILSGRGSIDHFKKNTKAALTRIIRLDMKQSKLLMKILELEFFMDIWSSKTIEELFRPKKVYDATKLENEHFLKILNELNKTSMDLHFEIIKVSRERKKEVPFTFSTNFDNKNNEKMELISRIIHNF
ncbi:MAG: hypothetical protein ACTSXO_07380 [Candidatus Heimdallarchaeota archaeon]